MCVCAFLMLLSYVCASFGEIMMTQCELVVEQKANDSVIEMAKDTQVRCTFCHLLEDHFIVLPATMSLASIKRTKMHHLL